MAKKNSWDRLEPLNVGDEKPEPIFLNVGIALSWFEELQLSMTMLFQKLIRGDLIAIMRAFGTLENVPPKVAMIQEAAKVRFFYEPERKKLIDNLMVQFGDLSHRRNEIAHGQVSKSMVDPEVKGYFLHPGIHATGKYKKLFKADFHPLGDYRYTATQIKHYTNEFRRLDYEVHLFMKALEDADAAHSPQASREKSSGSADADAQGSGRHK